jgi:2-keto-4-pentenoate hydratase/2-oxohepta-3-ene-1,7-dioic acid hydratase in catechol pathway
MKIFCVGRNYAEHANELKNEVPSVPVILRKTCIMNVKLYYEFARMGALLVRNSQGLIIMR